MYTTYLLNYDPLMTDPMPSRVLEFIRSNGYTYQYLVAYLGTVFIKSNATLDQMIQSYRPFLSPNPFTLTQVAPQLISGLLPQPYWSWLNSTSPPPLLTSAANA